MIENKIVTKKTFSQMIEELVVKNNIPYLEACLEVAEKLGFEPEDNGKLITPSLYEKMQAEASNAGLIKKDSNTAKLPI